MPKVVVKNDKKEGQYKVNRLYRSSTNRVLSGVAGGLGEYFNVDPTLIRLIFILVAIFGGGGILIYLILWLIIPSSSSASLITEESINENVKEMKDKAYKFAGGVRERAESANSRALIGIFILALGIMLLLSNFGFFNIFYFAKFWPVTLILLGIAVLSNKN
ncbi:hypothetical protein A3A76_01485 [Candidatus Woesebacteria bacterium RIFCSPLOWO2_01_FULL_39_23]|uniref:Phage shock protein PspC N-terminal domain-containing protein n=1 Tax=Candidatus Woesebacteria bacterium RIFCSPHIGHO2_01_FULL_40_22 TaxID=1802499 RepID=A0A1F7YGP2_9BACT|nr:MAG: hypothetical protein A2141_04885 [Candidatus Woesebacteria bacterium RBG_16_40_11]OGM26497.1 MAG: hypothetical protein A2628_03080 [Candidatus Woesebacteria bacterium RIFCSPHIGHO2_01_FULL_40_22]OGM37665.1 MAG: hypothetical protein A3E41_05600 [Candidatus Woesebacteria bacterium RIFCSPHIGHO2_12_FULL_38_9]OGM62950.1 MAG: hypothetical protein A3A76_01485 [Candidatus Woesebacteria bacterium RIFCSPLOWO2_01_FULL_39_23]